MSVVDLVTVRLNCVRLTLSVRLRIYCGVRSPNVFRTIPFFISTKASASSTVIRKCNTAGTVTGQ